MRIEKQIVVPRTVIASVLRCDVCGKEQQTGNEPGWLWIRGTYRPEVDSFRYNYDACSGPCAYEVVKRITVEEIKESRHAL